MKHLNIIFLLILSLSISSCQPTPSAPIVQSKNDGKLQMLINSEPAPVGKYIADEKWCESINGMNDTLYVNINADVHIPDADRYPVYRVFPDEIKQDEADRFFEYFLGAETTYNPDNIYIRTKAVIQEEILSLENQLSDPESQLNTDAKDVMSEEEWNEYAASVKQQIKDLQTEYKSAPANPTLEKTSRTFTKYNARSSEYAPFYMYKAGGVTIKENAVDKYAFAYKDIEDRRLYQDLQYSRYGAFKNYKYGILYNKTENLNNCELTYDEAKKYADDCINGLRYEGYSLETVFAAPVRAKDVDIPDDMPQSELPQGYVFTYTPQIDNIPLTYFRLKREVYWQIEEDSINSGYWTPPFIQITVDNDGVCMFNKQSAFKTDKLLNENIAMLDFEHIKDVFRKYIVMETDFAATVYEEGNYASPERRNINITDIKLGYMFIREINSDAYLAIPVFMFFGSETMTFKDQAHSPYILDENNQYRDSSVEVGHSYLTINAVDGSIIDMCLGY